VPSMREPNLKNSFYKLANACKARAARAANKKAASFESAS